MPRARAVVGPDIVVNDVTLPKLSEDAFAAGQELFCEYLLDFQSHAQRRRQQQQGRSDLDHDSDYDDNKNNSSKNGERVPEDKVEDEYEDACLPSFKQGKSDDKKVKVQNGTTVRTRRRKHAAPRVSNSIAVVDMRPLQQFESWHLLGSVHIPLSDIAQRGFELPPRHRPLLCLCSEGSDDLDGGCVKRCLQWFATRVGGNVVERWGLLRATGELRRVLQDAGLLQSGPIQRGHFAFSPCALLEEELVGPRLASVLELARQAGQSPEQPPGKSRTGHQPRALDLGCGSGRDAAFLASTGFAVLALDRDSRGLARLAALAQRHGFGAQVRTQSLKLVAEGDLLEGLSEELGTFDVVLGSRFLHRPTLQEIWRLLRPTSGLLLYHHFLEGNEHPTGEDKVLRSGELTALFKKHCEVLRDDELPIDDGRLLTFFVARRRSGGGTDEDEDGSSNWQDADDADDADDAP
eukprot:CAMPEP_0206458102 /NCGR_PEP_ID=MMETSP0324_2-20121206/23361_1 /ASSEMBLY_ACC=CAM_ASM_000836 /TAXON_ID=2866 /ORGANISM="Crypthecodinium cohnii, Strain Seligo" /LENGTH=463 /DNA_ID=CAMNT_0053929359 /DNA_START=62 /DNA_END=1448 /DNA_ORIENTATION=-